MSRRISRSAAFAAGIAAIAALCWISPPQQEVFADPPRIAAGYQTIERVSILLDLPAALADGKIVVELIEAGKRVAKVERQVAAGRAKQVPIVFDKVACKPATTTVRVRIGDKTVETMLAKILLSKAHETTLDAPAQLHAGSEAELRCQVRGVRSLKESVPLSAEVAVYLLQGKDEPKVLFEGKTNAGGDALIRFAVPEVSGARRLRVVTKSALGEEKLENDVNISASPKILLTTDKPLYQPGQTIHLRSLALRSFDLKPSAGAEMLFEIDDGKGNKVFKKELKADDYGIAHVDFTLASEVNVGEYRLRAILGDLRAEPSSTSAPRSSSPRSSSSV